MHATILGLAGAATALGAQRRASGCFLRCQRAVPLSGPSATHVSLATDWLWCAARYCSQRPPASGEDSDSHAAFTDVPSLDIFAQSRVTNYVNRVRLPAGPGSFYVVRLDTVDGGLVRATAAIPAEVLVGGQRTQTEVCAVGLGGDEKAARVACAMHAEYSLDALGVPLFTSERRQRERAELAGRQGRSAPLLAEAAPRELAEVALPPPVRLAPAAKSDAVVGGAATGAKRKPAPQVYGSVRLPSYQPNYHARPRRALRRHNQHRTRYGPDPFLSQVTAELAQLQHFILQRSAAEDGVDDDDGGGRGGGGPGLRLTIEAHEVSILRPRDDGGRDADDSDAAQRSDPAPLVLSRISGGAHLNYRQPAAMDGMRGHAEAALVDESEGGVFDLVEANGEVWWWRPEEPGPMCIRDPNAVARLGDYFRRTRQALFADCTAVHASQEPTSLLDWGRRCFKVREMGWFTASAALPEAGPGCTAIGKATTLEYAVDLCAMHVEALLAYCGIPIFAEPLRQVDYFAASLNWGRCVSPVPRSLDGDSGGAAPPSLSATPKPLKEWHLNTKVRYRSCAMSVCEKLLRLNRRVVGDLRQHLVELDFYAGPCAELAAIAEPCVRHYVVGRGHPFEAAYFNFVYQEGSQFRCSVYLPLPACFGIRGGCAIASTPARARQLAALSAVDTLCALNYVPADCLARTDWQRMLALRRELGFIVPSARVAHPHMRSPPGYREVKPPASRRVPLAEDVWRVMMLDADAFDVVPRLFPAEGPPQGKGGRDADGRPVVEWHTVLARLFATALRYLTSWGPEEAWDHMHHYCGAQHHHGQRRAAANNFWLLLPLDESKYGQRVAVGRCVTRVSALRHMQIHALRILYTLKAAPWEALPPAELLATMYAGNAVAMWEELQMWRVTKERLILDQGELPVTPPFSGPAVPAAEIVQRADPGAFSDAAPPEDMNNVLSPHPTMSVHLAKLTFL